MKLTSKQQTDLATIRHFIPENCTFLPIDDADVERFFAWSDRGIGGDSIKHEARQAMTGISALYWGKQRRDLQVASYLEDWGQFITAVDFVDEPGYLVKWLSVAMNKPGLMDV